MYFARLASWVCIWLALMAWVPLANAQRPTNGLRGKTRDAVYIETEAALPATYPFIYYKANKIDIDDELTPVFEHLSAADTQKINIVHLGDSHIQADVFSGTVRQRFQQIFGGAGRGFFFPNRVARSNNPDDFITSSTGTWVSTKNTLPNPTERLGASGFAVRTQDDGASITVKFLNPNGHAQGNRLTIWGQPGEDRFVPQVALLDSGQPYLQPDLGHSAPGYWVYTFPQPVTKGFTMQVLKTAPNQSSFVLQGYVLENTDSAGVLYHALGVNGAKILSYLQSPMLAEHLQSMHPSLIMLDVGVNDYYTAKILPPYIADSLTALINLVQKAVPGADIMLCSQQPNLRRRRHVAGARPYADLITDLARARKGVLAYNFYQVTQGKRSAQAWLRAGLMQKDGIHLSRLGYRLKGQLFTSAFLKAYATFLKAKP